MTHDELLTELNRRLEVALYNGDPQSVHALRAVVELANKQLETKDMPAEQVGWFNEGYNLAMDNIIDAIEKELK